MNVSASIRWTRRYVPPIISIVAVLSMVVRVHAQGNGHARGDSLITKVLFVGHLGFDCYRDTVVGSLDEDLHMVPRAIHWGLPTTGSSGDDSTCAGATPKRLRVRITEIRYPAWKHLTASVSFMPMNTDTLTDMVLILRGKPNDNWRSRRNSDGIVRSDSIRILLIPGQQGLDSIRTLNLASIVGFQSEPYFALELVEGTDVVDPAVRDVSGATSYEVKQVHLDVRGQREKDSMPRHEQGPQTADVDASSSRSVRLFPNPAHSTASVSAAPVPPGSYTIEIISTNGQTAAHYDIEVTSSRDLLSTFDVSHLASGYYIVRLSGQDRLIGTYPIIVTR